MSYPILEKYRQFMPTAVYPDPLAPGKLKKVTVDRAGNQVTAHDPAMWMSRDEARTLSPHHSFVLSAVPGSASRIICFDFDSCIDANGGLSPTLLQVMKELGPNVMWEVSVSGKGVHGWCWGIVPTHRNKNSFFNFEAYSDKRHMVLGTYWFGSMDLPCEGIAGVLSRYFPTDGMALVADADDWTTAPVPEWNGPADDNELINRACRAKGSSANLGFGDSRRKATFGELFHGEADALATCFPSSSGDDFDRSSADQALFNALAFWTGRDMERTERIARMSRLVRPKWDDRADYYLRGSIRKACQGKVNVYRETPDAPAAVAGEPAADGEAPARQFGAFVTPREQVEFFKGCVYVESENKVLIPGGTLVKPEVFTNGRGGHAFMLDAGNEKVTRKAFEAFTQSQVNPCPQAYGTCFRPDLPPATLIEDGDRSYVNTYWPINTPRQEGDPSLFITHMRKLFPNERDYTIMLSYMCAIVQYPGIKFQWAPLIQGVPGNGKSTLSRCVAQAIGKRYTHWPKASKLGAQFNGWMVDKIFYAVEDIHVSGMSSETMFEDLKPMITGEELEIEKKGVDQVSREICGNFIFNSNHKGSIRKTEEERRIAVFFTPQQAKSDLTKCGMDRAYFKRLRDWLTKENGYAIVTQLLLTMDIPAEFDPTRDMASCPETSSTLEAIEHGYGQIEQEVLECVAQDKVGFSGGWISGHYFDLLLERFKKDGTIPQNRRREMLQTLGYDWHPGLENGRVNNAVRPDGTKPKLYVKPGHPSWNLRGADVARAYTQAQLSANAPVLPGIPFGSGGTR